MQTLKPSAEELYAEITRKLKKTSARILERKLATGEYVLLDGRVVPATLVEESKAKDSLLKGDKMKTLKPHEELALAISVAAQGHLQQQDKAGKPYILHPLKVMENLQTEDFQLMAIAAMHDILEDTPMKAMGLVELGFSQRVVTAIVLLTKREGLFEQDYIDNIKTNQDAIRVKMADLKHNCDVLRLGTLNEKGLNRLMKYFNFYQQLKEALI